MNKYDTNLASEYYVLSVLYRKGFDAYLTLGNKKSVDILINSDKDKTITIDVKGIRGKTLFPLDNVTAEKRKPNHFLVFVSYLNRFRDDSTLPEIYVVPSVKIGELIYTNPKKNRIGVTLSNLNNHKELYLRNWEILHGYGELGYFPREVDEFEWMLFLRVYNSILSRSIKSRDINTFTENSLTIYQFLNIQSKYCDKYPLDDIEGFIEDMAKYKTLYDLEKLRGVFESLSSDFQKALEYLIKQRIDVTIQPVYQLPQTKFDTNGSV